ncbi:UNVERIFIED_CONTAM: hypothetical protein FKN15_070608 [Acipenser sinensis]
MPDQVRRHHSQSRGSHGDPDHSSQHCPYDLPGTSAIETPSAIAERERDSPWEYDWLDGDVRLSVRCAAAAQWSDDLHVSTEGERQGGGGQRGENGLTRISCLGERYVDYNIDGSPPPIMTPEGKEWEEPSEGRIRIQTTTEE